MEDGPISEIGIVQPQLLDPIVSSLPGRFTSAVAVLLRRERIAVTYSVSPIMDTVPWLRPIVCADCALIRNVRLDTESVLSEKLEPRDVILNWPCRRCHGALRVP